MDDALCADCASPAPQWASVSFAVLLCLHCAGVHRGFGVHVSFVRSLSMDAWHDNQRRRMQLGGNAPFKEFLRAYPPEGGYEDGMDAHALYHSWAATQYREKLDFALAGKPWAPSSPPSSPQGLRKSRASARGTDPSANEALRQANPARTAVLPPSQSGRYQGFGNTPPPSALTSAAVPSLADFQDSPAAALSKGWSLFSAVVGGATRAVNDNVIQPGMVRVMDPNLHASVRGYVAGAQRRAQEVGHSVNEWSKLQLGVEVGGVVDTIGARPAPSGYASLASHDDGETSALYDDTSDLFHEYSDTSPSQAPADALGSGGKAKKDDDWDEWQDF